MYFPENMNFQYFFFDTYIGYFLQALPIALLAGAVYGILRYRKHPAIPAWQKVFSCAFVCYMTGLVCLVLLFDWMGDVWYWLLYHHSGDRGIDWFGGCFDFGLDLLGNIRGETVGNFLMFLPFGFLYPLSRQNTTWSGCMGMGLVTVLTIEVLQPVFGRAFDLNDIVLNTLGIAASASIFFLAKNLLGKGKR